MAPGFDAAFYPQLFSLVLYYLHHLGYHKTLANCRLSCSSVKDEIDRRLPPHLVFHAENSKGATAITRLWNAELQEWDPPRVKVVVDLYNHLYAEFHKASRAEMELKASQLCDEYGAIDVLRQFHNDVRLTYPCNTTIIFPEINGDMENILLPPRVERVILNRRYSPLDTPLDYAFFYSTEDIPLLVEQELALLFTPQPLDISLTSSSDLIEDFFYSISSVLRRNRGLKVIIVGSEHWQADWIMRTEDTRLAGISGDRERFAAAWEGRAEELEVAPALSSDRVEYLTDAEYAARVGPTLWGLINFKEELPAMKYITKDWDEPKLTF